MQAFDVLRDPIRRRVLEVLAQAGELTSGAVRSAVLATSRVGRAAVSPHLKVLRDNGFVTVRPAGARRFYAVNAQPLREIDEWLERFRHCPHSEENSMIDINRQIDAVRRQAGVRKLDSGDEGRTLTLSQSFPTGIDDLWDACTNPDRLAAWFESVSGDLKPNGRYKLASNTTGTIRRCESPQSLAVTWEYEGDVSWVEVRLSAEAEDRTVLELEHYMAVNDNWDEYGPGSGGVGWDRSFFGLAAYLAGQPVAPDSDWDSSDEGVRFVTLAADKWCEADIAAGADPREACDKAERTKSFYTASAPS